MEFGNRLLAQSAAMGALPTLYAATAPDVHGGDYIGPDGFGEQWGHPKKVRSNARSHDRGGAAAPVGYLEAACRRALRGAVLSWTLRWQQATALAVLWWIVPWMAASPGLISINANALGPSAAPTSPTAPVEQDEVADQDDAKL